MNYTNQNVRRKDRVLSEQEAIELLQRGEYGILSMVDTSGNGYGIPINFVWNGAETIYLHCAPQGEKLTAIRANPAVSFCVIGHTNVLSDKFTTEYESVIVRGEALVVDEDNEKMEALKLLLDKYSPEDKVVGLKYAEKSFARTAIIRLNITSMSGKCKKAH